MVIKLILSKMSKMLADAQVFFSLSFLSFFSLFSLFLFLFSFSLFFFSSPPPLSPFSHTLSFQKLEKLADKLEAYSLILYGESLVTTRVSLVFGFYAPPFTLDGDSLFVFSLFSFFFSLFSFLFSLFPFVWRDVFGVRRFLCAKGLFVFLFICELFFVNKIDSDQNCFSNNILLLLFFFSLSL